MHTDKKTNVVKEILSSALGITEEQVTQHLIWFFFDRESRYTWTQKKDYDLMIKAVKERLQANSALFDDDVDAFLKSLPPHAELIA